MMDNHAYIVVLLQPPFIFLGLILAAVLFLYSRRQQKDDSRLDVFDWVGPRKECFSKLRSALRYHSHGITIIDEGYKKFNKIGKPFVTPLATARPVVVVPPSDIEWLAKRPKNQLLPPQMIIHSKLVEHYHPDLPKGEFTHMPTINVDMKKVTPSVIWRQVCESVDPSFGEPTVGTEWKIMKIFDFVGNIVARVSIGLFLSKKLSHDEEFVQDVIMYTTFFNIFPYQFHYFIPDVLKPVFVPLIAAPSRYYLRKLNKKLLPIIHQHLSGSGEDDDQNTVLHHHVESARWSSNPADHDPRVITSRFCLLIGALAIPTLYQSLSDAVTNMARETGETKSIQEVIRGEVASVLDAGNGQWLPQYSASLIYTDSFLKESLRYHTFNGFGLGLNREVVASEGVRIPSAKDSVVPKGTWITVASDAIHRDSNIYEAADEFRPWRWVVKSAVKGDSTQGQEKEQNGTKVSEAAAKVLDLPATSDTFLAFGRGKDTCPGRFFAADYMRLALAYIALHYEIRRPANTPDRGAPSIEIRRRRATSINLVATS